MTDQFQMAQYLREVPDSALQTMQNYVPRILVLTEMDRRNRMRQVDQAVKAGQAVAANGGATVADQVQRQFSGMPAPGAPPQQQPGLPPGQMPPGQPQAPQPQQMPPAGAIMQQLAKGGMVRYREGGGVQRGPWAGGYDTPPPAPPPAPVEIAPYVTPEQYAEWFGKRMTPQEAMGQIKGMYGEDPMAPILAELAKFQAKEVVSKPNPFQALMAMGAGMMTSRSPNFLGGLGEGVKAGLSHYGQDRAAYQQDQARVQKQMAEMLEARMRGAQSQANRQNTMAQSAQELLRSDTAAGNQRAQVFGNAEIARSGDRARLQLEKMREDRDAPLREEQIAGLRANRLSQEAENSLIKQMGPKAYEEWKAKLRQQPQHYSLMDQAAFRAVQSLVAQGVSYDEAYSRVMQGRRGDGLIDDATAIFRILVSNDPMAQFDPNKQKVHWATALEMARNKTGAAAAAPEASRLVWDPTKKTFVSQGANGQMKQESHLGTGGKGHTLPGEKSPEEKRKAGEAWLNNLRNVQSPIGAGDMNSVFGR